MVINVHAGHNPDGKVAYGAVGLIRESTEARLVKNAVISKLQAQGHTVYDCTCEDGTSQNDVLCKIVKKCNEHKVDLDISIHFNCCVNDYVGDGKTTGSEVWVYPGDSNSLDYGSKIVNSLSELGLKNRGVKTSTALYFLNNTKSSALLIEVLFVDDKDDVDVFRKVGVEGVANAIVKSIGGAVSQPQPQAQPQPQPTPTPQPIVQPTKTTAVYGVKANSRILPDVKDTTDYAGVDERKVSDFKLAFSDGKCAYQVHILGGGWLPEVTGANWNDGNNGYAGDGRVIDGIRIRHTGGKKAKYRVSTTGTSGYLPWVTNYEDFAGIFGKAINKVQVYVE